MSLYDDEEPKREEGSKDLAMKFLGLQSQIAQKRSAIQMQMGMQRPATNNPVVDLSRNRGGVNMRPMKPVKATPVDITGITSFLPRAATDESVMLFGEVVVKNEYQPAVPNDYLVHRKKKDERDAREKAAKEVADRLAREHKEEARKREKGAAIAPPQALMEEPPTLSFADQPKIVQSVSMPPPTFLPPTSFGKASSRGLGIAASIMSKQGYREGSGLGRSEQGMATALSVEKMGRNAGVIIEGAQSQSSVASLSAPSAATSRNATDVIRFATKVLLLTNIPDDDEAGGDEEGSLEEEMKEELSKYGQVQTVVVKRIQNAPPEESPRVFVEFTNQAQAIKACIVMNGRFFAGREVVARFYNVDDYNSKNYDGPPCPQPSPDIGGGWAVFATLEEMPVVVSRMAGKVRPELDVILDAVLWTTRVFNGASPGQIDEDISYKDYSTPRVVRHFVVSILLPYIVRRLPDFNSNSTTTSRLRKLEAVTECVSLLHHLLFLFRGGYSNLAESCLRLRNWNNSMPTLGTVNYANQNRELLWHSFRDALLLVWPIWIATRKRWNKETTRRAGGCARCGDAATMPRRYRPCDHVVCYWCASQGSCPCTNGFTVERVPGAPVNCEN